MSRLFFVLLLTLPFRVLSQDISVLLRQGAQLESAFKEEEAFSRYEEVLRLQPRNIIALCRCSDLSCRIGNRQVSKDKKVPFFKAGREYAGKAWLLDSTSSEVNIVMAFSIARMALIASPREKVAAANDVRRYAGNAIRDDPASFKAWHILGRWNYEVSALSVIERTLARWFFGAIPEASLSQAVVCYEKSMSLRPSFMLNYLELAKACRREGQKARAIGLLQHMETLKDEMLDDRQVRQEGRKLLAELTE